MCLCQQNIHRYFLYVGSDYLTSHVSVSAEHTWVLSVCGERPSDRPCVCVSRTYMGTFCMWGATIRPAMYLCQQNIHGYFLYVGSDHLTGHVSVSAEHTRVLSVCGERPSDRPCVCVSRSYTGTFCMWGATI